jgi:hypothetical protein
MRTVSVIERITYHRGRRDEVPNQELARELARAGDADGVADIAAHLDDQNKRIASDCIKVLYEVGYIDPSIIEPYTGTFMDLLGSGHNRMVWGAMIALWTVAPTQHAVIWERVEELEDTIRKGSVITVDAGVKTLAIVAAQDDRYEARLRPFLFGILRQCQAKRLASFAEDMSVMVNDSNVDEFLSIVTARHDELSVPQARRLGKVVGRFTIDG